MYFIFFYFSDVHKIKTEKIIHTPPSFGFTCNYTAIRVNRSNNYTQIILKLTRGKSIFLTLEVKNGFIDIHVVSYVVCFLLSNYQPFSSKCLLCLNIFYIYNSH